MKISKSKQELARIISENGGWREGNYAIQDKDDECVWFMFELEGRPNGRAFWPGVKSKRIKGAVLLPNWHQTILSRAEYLHLYPAPDVDGWIEWNGGAANPVEFGVLVDVKLANGEVLNRVSANSGAEWRHCWGDTNIIAYRLHKPESEIQSEIMGIAQVGDINVVESKPTIEQLAADYRNANDYAERKQKDADDAKADAEVKLEELIAAGKALGLDVSPITANQELVITDWRDLKVGDIIQCVGSWEKEKTDGMQLPVTELEGPHYNGDLPIRVEVPGISCPGTWGINFKFIRRP